MDEIVHRVGRYLNDHAEERVTLRSLADHLGISPWHLQRTFRSRVGLSPKRYHDALRVRRFKAHLKRGQTVTQATYEAGYGSGSRVYERVAPAIGMTPGTFRAGGKGVTLRYATMPTEVGELLVAATERGVVSVSLGDDEASLVKMLKEEFPHATVRRDRQGLNHDVRTIQYGLRGTGKIGLLLDVKTTAFQRKVWQALQEIPRGQTRSYREVAEMIGLPTASRAVARACATNPIAVAIPCHRVVRADGRPAGYRWGIQRKKQLLALEQR
jgi:AraC family transcriptional regulator of adaptative response/methylated-DNA-[protein]-cysteine methyltransferase